MIVWSSEALSLLSWAPLTLTGLLFLAFHIVGLRYFVIFEDIMRVSTYHSLSLSTHFNHTNVLVFLTTGQVFELSALLVRLAGALVTVESLLRLTVVLVQVSLVV